MCTDWGSITTRFFLAVHNCCACSEDVIVNLIPIKFSSCSLKSHQLWFLGTKCICPQGAVCLSGMQLPSFHSEQGASHVSSATAPSSLSQWWETLPVCLCSASKQQCERARSVHQGLCHGGTETWWECVGRQECCATTTIPLQQQHSNAQCWCSLPLTASQLAQSYAAEQAQGAHVCASMDATDFSASALYGDAKPLAKPTLGCFCLCFAMTSHNKSGKCE